MTHEKRRPMMRLRGFSRHFAALLVAGLLTTACGPSRGADGPPPSSLPDYTPEEAALFDDVLAPKVFDVDVDDALPSKDRKLGERTRNADFVVIARVSTLTRDGAEERGPYRMTLEPLGQAFNGAPPSGPFDILVPAGSPSYALLHANRHAWVGRRLVLFGRRYNLSGEAVLHWRGEPDTPEMLSAIKEHALLR